jgi:glycine cleavage system regulatory protein
MNAADRADILREIRSVRRLLIENLARSEDIMTILEDLQAQSAALNQKAAEAAADASRSQGLMEQTVALLQNQREAIAALQEQVAQGQGVSKADLVAIRDANQAALDVLDGANVVRDAADAALTGQVSGG